MHRNGRLVKGFWDDLTPFLEMYVENPGSDGFSLYLIGLSKPIWVNNGMRNRQVYTCRIWHYNEIVR